ncbi:MAG: hypothetical protein QM658_06335 [Gordonia sp. (in: high G+C Gram-positive bacteria)]
MSDALLVLTEAHLHDDVARCGAAAGYRLVRGDPRGCRRDWTLARAVVVDGPALTVLQADPPPAGPGVVVVSASDADPELWRAGLAFGARGGYLLPGDDAALVEALSRIREPRRRPGGSVAVLGGHGGAGASTLAAAVGLTACGGGSGLLVDVDPVGAGLDLILGVEAAPGMRWNDVTGHTGSIDPAALAAALPARGDRLRVITRARDDGALLDPETVLAVVDAGLASGDPVVADVGRGLDPAAAGVLDSADLVVVVVAASVPAVASARRTVARLDRRCPARLVVRGPSPGGLRADHVADAVGLELLAAMRPEAALPRDAERGGLRLRRRSGLRRAAAQVCEVLAGTEGRRA